MDKLKLITNLMMEGDLVKADEAISSLYDDYSACRIWLTADESKLMFSIMDNLAHTLYA